MLRSAKDVPAMDELPRTEYFHVKVSAMGKNAVKTSINIFSDIIRRDNTR